MPSRGLCSYRLLDGLCRFHHILKHPGWWLTQPAPGVFRWITPAVRSYTAIPEPRVAGSRSRPLVAGLPRGARVRGWRRPAAGLPTENAWPVGEGSRRLLFMGSITWGPDVAEVYDTTYAAGFAPSVLDPVVGLLAALAGDGPALEFAVGTGRVALALSARGIPVHGLELSRAMAERLLAKPGAGAVPVTIGDMTAARVPGGPFTLVYLVANTIMNVTTQDDQVAVFANAAAHLGPGEYS
jgi:hypothetical protein